ncbi:ferrichrome-binding protein [Halogranum amylolyticum]|uniref:Ferrichrome-binding protein n=1 Tax=Halogranum amylolyticum TaxID=660520 RepID=A0A1H8P5N0_9EURY|nr:ABC transporter substrate-binding protein [Halogranum amylolyticum]SEO37216.1 ferrichrome-binding protein [Halogranum amylolyticum]
MQRRTFLGVGASALTVGLAGCAGSEGSEATTGEPETNGSTTNGTSEGTADSESGSYTVSMVPVGDVTFEAVPKSWLVYESGYADMGVALGKADGLAAVGNKARYHTQYYDQLDGVSVDKEGLTQLVGESAQIDKELFYELDVDVHLVDPNWLTSGSSFGLEQSDVDELSESVAPFIGNTIFRRTDSSAWHNYDYYTMYEAFEKVAQIFQEQERYQAFKSFHDNYVDRVQSELPAEGERPNALLTFAAGDEPEQFYPYRLSDQGTNKKQFHDLGIKDALEGTGIDGLSTSDRGTVDYEAMLEVDPDAILVRGHESKTAKQFRNTVLSFMQQHDVASQLTAVQNEMVFRGGPIYQGPIQHLFTLERAATDFFPDSFSGELFDRGKLSSVISG